MSSSSDVGATVPPPPPSLLRRRSNVPTVPPPKQRRRIPWKYIIGGLILLAIVPTFVDALGQTSVDDLVIGDCFADDYREGGSVTLVDTQPCEQPHQSEFFAAVRATSVEAALAQCVDRLLTTGFLGMELPDDFDLYVIEDTSGNDPYLCIAYSASGELAGSLVG